MMHSSNTTNIPILNWTTKSYYRTSPRTFPDQNQNDENIVIIDDSNNCKWSPTNKLCCPFDKSQFDNKIIYLDFVLDKNVWDFKSLKFDYQKNKAVNFVSISVGIEGNDSDHVFIFSDLSWQFNSPQTTHGWIDELIELLSAAKEIIMFDQDLFYGVLRHYLLREMIMMRWRIKTKSMSEHFRKKEFGCWKRLTSISLLNNITCPGVDQVLNACQEYQYEKAKEYMVARVVALGTLYDRLVSNGINIPNKHGILNHIQKNYEFN